MTDFCQLVLPQDNTILRATASQRITHPASQIQIQVEQVLSNLLKQECDLHETVERMKIELESLQGFSTKRAFNKIDRGGKGFLDVSAIRDFISINGSGK